MILYPYLSFFKSILKFNNKNNPKIFLLLGPASTKSSIKKLFSNKKLLTAITFFIILIMAAIIGTAVYLNLEENPDDTIGSLNLITKSEWGALPVNDTIKRQILPLKKVTIIHTVTRTCSTKISCSQVVKFIQELHIKNKDVGDDIGYNFLVGGDGSVYEGRGWDLVGAHTYPYNTGYVGIAFIGDFRTDQPTKPQLNGAKLLLAEGVKLGKLDPNYKLYGQWQLSFSESPGKNLYEIIQKWSHWSEEIK